MAAQRVWGSLGRSRQPGRGGAAAVFVSKSRMALKAATLRVLPHAWRGKARARWLRRAGLAGLACVFAAGTTALPGIPAASAATGTVVSLTFDNGAISQYALAYQQALQPHGANATFFVNSGTVGASGNFMSWAQLGTLAGAGNDIGGKTVNATNLTTDPNPTAQVSVP